MPRFSLRRGSAIAWMGVLVLASALAACSTEVEVRTTAADVPTAADADAPAADSTAGTAADVEDPAVTDGAGASEPDGASSDETDPGPMDPLYTPARGEAVAVVGVAFDDSVAVRRAARPDAAVVLELAARFDAAIGTGQGRTVGTTGWWRIRVGEQQGWVEASSMARLGATTDVTDDVISVLGGMPVAPTPRALGRLVAQARLGDGEPDGLVLSAAPRSGNRSEVIYDIVDRRDVSIVGERLVVSAEPAEDGEGFSLRAVEATTFCARGVTADGRCT